MKSFIPLLFSVLLLISFGCMEKVDLGAEKAKILEILAADDQELLDGVLKESDTSTEESINIMEGNLERITEAEAKSFLQQLIIAVMKFFILF